jgi:hypothetical protein
MLEREYLAKGESPRERIILGGLMPGVFLVEYGNHAASGRTDLDEAGCPLIRLRRENYSSAELDRLYRFEEARH